MSFLEPSALLVWLAPTLGIYSWADVAAEEAAYRVCLFVLFIILQSLSWPPFWKKPTQPTSRELNPLWLYFPLLFRSLLVLPPCHVPQAGVQPRATNLLWASRQARCNVQPHLYSFSNRNRVSDYWNSLNVMFLSALIRRPGSNSAVENWPVELLLLSHLMMHKWWTSVISPLMGGFIYTALTKKYQPLTSLGLLKSCTKMSH